MNFIDRHKALLITILITGILILGMFSFHIKKQMLFISETYYEIEPQTQNELEELERIKSLEEQLNNDPSTNEAYNEDEEFKEMMRNFKTVSNVMDEAPEEDITEANENPESSEAVLTSSNTTNAAKTYALKERDRQSFSKANDILAKQAENNKRKSSSNANSSVTFSLSNRDKIFLPPPVYLCEVTGKIVVNITVNNEGLVTDTYINTSSSSNNQCLIDHALEYAKNARFTSAERKQQIGSITYYFKGK